VPKTLQDYLNFNYALRLIPDPDGGYVFEYPDLPGCLGQIDSLDELPEHAEEARRLWLATAYELGKEIPLPGQRENYSGKFVVRIAKSLHRRLAESAETEGISLNSYVATLLAAGQAESTLSARIDELCAKVDALHAQLTVTNDGLHSRSAGELKPSESLPPTRKKAEASRKRSRNAATGSPVNTSAGVRS
jgi:antitoxin HicB